MNITKIVLFSIFCLFIILILRKAGSDYAFFVSAAAGIFICVFSIGILKPVFEFAKELCEDSSTGKLCTIIFKSAGICLLCSMGAEICRDFNEGSIASKIEFAGKCTLLSYCLPLIKAVFDYATTFIG